MRYNGVIEGVLATGIIIAVATIFIAERPSSTVASQTTIPVATEAPAVPGHDPVSLEITRLGINQAIAIKHVDPNITSWPVDDYGANVMAEFARPGSSAGATIIYGHNHPKIFGNLMHAKIGDELTIALVNNTTVRYTLTELSTISSTDLSILKTASTGEPRVILMTCIGDNNEQRIIATFKEATL